MEAIPDAVNTEALLAHADWVRALARTLVADPNRADDVAQEAWVAALENPPRDARNLRGWFASVVRNAASQARRSETRRTAREQAAAREEGVPDTAELVARASLQRDLVGHVLALEEPYRRTILLRFFQGLEVREIAQQEGVELSTVRTRLQRGIAKLRERLDREHGERSDWLPAVAALARPVAPAAVAVAAGTWIASLAACVAIVGAVWWMWPAERTDPADAQSERTVVESGSPARESSKGDPRAVLAVPERAERTRVGSSATPEPTVPAADIPRARVQGRVVDLRGDALPGLRLRARDRTLPRREGEWIYWRTGETSSARKFPNEELQALRENPEEVERVVRGAGDPPGLKEVLLGVDVSAPGTTAADGSFDIEGPGTDLRLECDDEAWVFAGDGWTEAHTVHLFVAAPAIDVGGTVVDASAVPVQGASVEFGTAWPALEEFPLDVGSGSGNSWQVSSGTDGRFRLARIPSIPGAGLRAWKEGFKTAVAAEPDRSDDGVTIVMVRETPRARPHVRGIVLSERGAPVAQDARPSRQPDVGARHVEDRDDLSLGERGVRVELDRPDVAAERQPVVEEGLDDAPAHERAERAREHEREPRAVDEAGRTVRDLLPRSPHAERELSREGPSTAGAARSSGRMMILSASSMLRPPEGPRRDDPRGAEDSQDRDDRPRYQERVGSRWRRLAR